jgi:hypothetical protein
LLPEPTSSATFYLGAHRPHWLGLTDAPLFVSHSTLRGRRTLPRARGRWALDSGGFSELAKHGRWTVSAASYAASVQRYQREIGGLDFAAQQDWMCEPFMLAKTGLTVAEHQRRTIANYLELRELAPEVPWMPVLQGWAPADYFAHLAAYRAAGVELAELPIVGVGSICRRQHTGPIQRMLAELSALGVRLHGFGLKLSGFRACSHVLTSADSMAWSYHARKERNGLQNDLGFALEWRERVAA